MYVECTKGAANSWPPPAKMYVECTIGIASSWPKLERMYVGCTIGVASSWLQPGRMHVECTTGVKSSWPKPGRMYVDCTIGVANSWPQSERIYAELKKRRIVPVASFTANVCWVYGKLSDRLAFAKENVRVLSARFFFRVVLLKVYCSARMHNCWVEL